MKTFSGIIRGKVIELSQDPGFADGQPVRVTVLAAPQQRATLIPKEPLPWWLQRLDINPDVRKGKYVVKGTSLLADDLIAEMDQGRSDDEILQAHSELTPPDVAAVREYARVPAGLRRVAGSWAEDAAELDEYLEWNRRQRKVSRPEIDG